MSIAREYFPEDGAAFIDDVVWSLTGYPCFWRTNDAEDCFRQQLAEASDRMSRCAPLIDDLGERHW